MNELSKARYDFITTKQTYFTELARNTFASYIAVLTSLCAGGVALVSVKEKLEIKKDLLLSLVHSVAYLVTFLGAVSVIQIIFCLVRWYSYRYEEYNLNRASGKPAWWAWIFEACYLLAIFASIIALWVAIGKIGQSL